MKIVTIIGGIIAATALSIGIYNQIEILPSLSYFERLTDRTSFDKELLWHYRDQKFFFGNMTLIGGIIGLACGIIGIRMHLKMGKWVAIIGILAAILGILHQSHILD